MYLCICSFTQSTHTRIRIGKKSIQHHHLERNYASVMDVEIFFLIMSGIVAYNIHVTDAYIIRSTSFGITFHSHDQSWLPSSETGAGSRWQAVKQQEAHTHVFILFHAVGGRWKCRDRHTRKLTCHMYKYIMMVSCESVYVPPCIQYTLYLYVYYNVCVLVPIACSDLSRCSHIPHIYFTVYFVHINLLLPDSCKWELYVRCRRHRVLYNATHCTSVIVQSTLPRSAHISRLRWEYL